MGMGIIAGGVSVGGDVFKRNFVAQTADEVSGQIKQNHTLLRSANAHDHAFHVLRLSDSHRLDYLTQVVSPYAPGVLDEYRRRDTALHHLYPAAPGVDFRNLDPATHTDPGPITQRAHLAKRHNGAGIVRLAGACFASFVGCVDMAVAAPRLANGVRADGSIIRGLAAHLEPVAGSATDFSVAQSRYRAFLGPGLSQAEGFGLAWNAIREEAGRDPAGAQQQRRVPPASPALRTDKRLTRSVCVCSACARARGSAPAAESIAGG
jgi:hypothetical protein